MKKILFLSAMFFSSLFAKDMYIFNEKVNLYDVSTKKVVGSIYEGTKVDEIKKEGEYSLIKVKGEVVANNPKTLAYTKDGIYVLLTLNSKNAKNEMEFLVKSKDLTNDEVAAWDEVELAYYDTCTSCHAAKKPKEHLMNEWDALLSAMQGFAKINDAEKDRILRFLQSHASDGPVKLN